MHTMKKMYSFEHLEVTLMLVAIIIATGVLICCCYVLRSKCNNRRKSEYDLREDYGSINVKNTFWEDK